MSFVSVRLPKDFIDETKDFADKDFRTIPQQILYWADLGRQQELREWQLAKTRLGLEQAINSHFAPEDEVQRVFNKCKNIK